MTLHDRLKHVGEDRVRPAAPGWNAVVLGVVLAVLAAGFAVAMPYTLRPVEPSGEPSGLVARAIAPPRVAPAAVRLPSPAPSTGRLGGIAAAPSPRPTVELGAPTMIVRTPLIPPIRKQLARREDDDDTDDHGPDDEDDEPSQGPRHSADNSGASKGGSKGGSKNGAKNDDETAHHQDHSKDDSKDDSSNKGEGKNGADNLE